MARPTLSVIIPALNEANSLPLLLDALNAQTRPPDEILVADAGSKDRTVEQAQARGARVVPGGRPAAGRNAGARAATGELFLFLDADVLPGRDFIAQFLEAFRREPCDVATCLIEPLSDNHADLILTEATNLYLQIVQPFSPHAPGFCILVRREYHQAIGGFDETVKLAEDHIYVQRAAQHGTFCVLTSVRIPVSMRRIEKEGLTRLAIKYLWCEMHALAGQPIYSTPFEYEFGTFGGVSTTEHDVPRRKHWLQLIDIAQLREELGRFENPLNRLSAASLGRLEKLASLDWLDATRERLRLSLDPPDLDILQRYLHRRRALLRLTGRPLRQTLARLQNTPLLESIRFLDWEWLRGRGR